MMDFIERWFGLSPDGGDGSLEALYLTNPSTLESGIDSRLDLHKEKRMFQAIAAQADGAGAAPLTT
jgi:hypothetical protein